MDSHRATHDDPLTQTIASINAAPVSQGVFADLAYPPALTHQIAARVLRESFESHFRVVPAMRPMRRSAIAHAESDAFDASREYPSRRGASWHDIDQPIPADLAPLAAKVGAMLAPQGLVRTACFAAHAIGPARVSPAALSSLGFPVDLLAYALGFSRDLHGQNQACAAIAAAITLDVDAAPEALARSHPPKPWAPTSPSQAARSDAGDMPHTLAIVALARDDYLFGPGDGGALDHVRACVHAIAPTPTLVLTHDAARAAELINCPSAVYVPWPTFPGQFIRDACVVLQSLDAPTTLLLPRYPSRGEIGSPIARDWLPFADLLAPALQSAAARAGIEPPRVAISPLHFHGGDILTWRDGDIRRGLVGHATIARNTALGLSEPLARDAIRRELGLDELTVVPASTFHIDTRLSVLAHGPQRHIMAADHVAAAALILAEGCERLRRAGLVPAPIHRAIATSLARLSAPDIANVVSILATQVLPATMHPHATPLPSLLAPQDPDGGGASAMQFLHAVDVLASTVPNLPVPDHFRAYFAALAMPQHDQSPKPSVRLPGGVTGPRAALSLNMVHLANGVSLVPMSSSVCAQVDARVRGQMERFGRSVCLIPGSESGLRQGGVRCSLVLLG